MIKLTGLILENFLSYKHAEINFEDLGLCFIRGHNMDEDESNGAGKTTIPSAICWCLFGRTVKGIAADDVINWDVNKNCMVRLYFERVGGGQFSITRWRNYDEVGDAVEISMIPDKHVGKPSEMQPMINQLIGFDYETFVNTSVYSQETSQMLGSATDADRRKIFSKLLNLARYNRAHNLAKAKMDELIEKQRDLFLSIEKTNVQIETLNGEIEANKTYIETYDKNRQDKIKQFEEYLEKLPKKKRVKGLQREAAVIGEEFDKIDVASIESEASELLGDVKFFQKKIAEFNQDLTDVPEFCSKCKRKFSEKDLSAAREHIREELNKYSELRKDAAKKLKNRQGLLNKAHPLRTKLFEIGEEISKMRMHNEKIDSSRETLNTQIRELKETKNPFMKAQTNLEEKLEKLEQWKRSSEALRNVMDEEIQKWDFVTWLYSKKGAPSYIIENSFEYIQNQANYYLMILTGGNTTIELNAERELKSSKMKEEITLIIHREGHDIAYKSLSDGERQRVNIALLFAINAYCRSQGNLDFLLLDEILDLSLDATGVERVMALLKEIGKEVGTIFVISHKDGIKDEFDSVLNVVKKNGESRII